MRRPLFWKIFFGICVTCFVVSQIVWLTYAILSPRPSETTRALARISLAAARQSIEIGGGDALARQIRSWPSDERGHIDYRLLGPAKVVQPDPDNELSPRPHMIQRATAMPSPIM